MLTLEYYLVGEGVPRSALKLYAATSAPDDVGSGVQARLTFVVEEKKR
jgi:hypothetical protein